MTADILREKFLNFFKAKKHKIVESDSLVPRNDPTVLFTPAGMNQFKKQFLGFTRGFRRLATSQRCLRTDDLDKVGKTSGHHTFFEMLGNFSFGDYFKKEAISWSWEFLTEKLNIDAEKLWVSVYQDDIEAYGIWKDKVKVPQDKILKLGDKENFWPSQAKTEGPNGPCGPCSEIFFDQGSNIGCGRSTCNPSCDCGRFVEVWNLVFTQFNRKEGGILEPLPKKNIDTGMGLERLVAVMQQAKSNFETDLFQPIIKEIASGIKPQAQGEKGLIYAIADHIRAIVFAIYDGVLPSNEARGYVIRKLIRKSTFHLNKLGVKEPFLYKLVPVVSDIMRIPYPELDRRKENIAEIILAEEKNFILTLSSSDSLFNEKFSGLVSKQDSERAGKIAFQLYDTYGIPPELTFAWLDKHKIEISQGAFNKELEEQKSRSKLQSAMKGDVFDIKDLHSSGKETKFLGYTKYETKANIIRIIKDSVQVKKVVKGEEAKIILDKTVFYPESGGQVGDIGELKKGKNIFSVSDTKKIEKVIAHVGKVREGGFKVGDELTAGIDVERRLSIARNHTATHLLQAALRKVLGPHVQQQGSLVAEDRLRFDFTHFKNINNEQLNRIEEIVNSYIINNHILYKEEMPLASAKKTGALAFFAEKYEGKVRVISISDFSKELCGGTHLDSTAAIGIFKIIQEGSVASGIRRIEALTGDFAYKKTKEGQDAIAQISSTLNVPQDMIIQELEKRLTRLKELEKQLYSRALDSIAASVDSLIRDAQEINSMKFIAKIYEGMDINLLRKTVDLIKAKTKNTVIALAQTSNCQLSLIIGVTEDLCEKNVDASWLIKEIASDVGGSGGGRKDFAQAGGSRPENIQKAFAKLKNLLSQIKL